MSLIYPGDFSQGEYSVSETYPSGTTGAQTFGPFRLPYSPGGQSAEIVTAWIGDKEQAIAATASLETAPTKDGPWARIGAEQTLTEGLSIQSVYCGGDFVRFLINFTSAPAAAVDVVVKAKARAA